MVKPRLWRWSAALALGLGLCGFVSGPAFAAQYAVVLQGSGPVYTDAMQPGYRNVRVTVYNHNNLNVGFDLIEQGTGTVIANGTIKDRGSASKIGTAHAGRRYMLRLRCQEPPWNHTKCNAAGTVSWP